MKAPVRLVCTLLPLLIFLVACNAPASPTDTPPPPDIPHSIHLELGSPHDADTTDDFLIVRPQYAVSYNHRMHVPNWVSWNLNTSWFGDVPRYDGRFLSDPLLPNTFYHAVHNDYTNTGYDRGHMVRSEERTGTVDDNLSTFYMTNILPQRPDLNRGVWLDFERYCESLCKDSLKQLFIIAGPVFTTLPPAVIGHGIAVPDSCFKIVVVLDTHNRLADVTTTTRVLAVVMPNTDGVRSHDWTLYSRTVDHVEALTGYDFLDLVRPDIQAVIEAQ